MLKNSSVGADSISARTTANAITKIVGNNQLLILQNCIPFLLQFLLNNTESVKGLKNSSVGADSISARTTTSAITKIVRNNQICYCKMQIDVV